uniref:Uncharacterized protein n=1 Tax=viral metagenome TaxID=1070528 RepID=A0A6M3LJ40_9ZZZZ
MLKIDLSALSYDYAPIKYQDDITLELRLYPASRGGSEVNLAERTLRFSGAEQCAIFKHCLGDWDGVVGGDDKPLVCTDAVKQTVFDFRFKVDRFGDLVNFVLAWNQQGLIDEAGKKGAQLKNLSGSPDGRPIAPEGSAPAAPAK